ncbi:hypothetical protein POM88_028540 [Heracleum sosnowskyi]|uniref:Uncharacterized protein n=1 Tax=Heracleum sosnowskyi TaxID=360622 RepID=A0AAD8MGU0_9APIA|nr:hypothetical protein POM88_028540 [Heracleum sosnowskyi]
MWSSMSNASNGNPSLKGYNLILLDDDDCHVHTFIYSENWKVHAKKIDEGSVYVISNFYTKEATGSLKPVSSPMLINFSPSTSVEKVEEDEFMIPYHKFEFVDLSDLFSVASNNANVDFPEFSTDVIGIIEDFEYLSKIKTVYGEKNIVKFRLTDGRHSHKVTVWGALAVSTDAVYKAIKEATVIVIVSSCKLKNFRRLSEDGYVPQEKSFYSPARSDFVPAPVIETLSLKELSEKTSSEFLKDESTKEYPLQIKEICGKDVTLQIELNDDNIHLSSTIYTTNDAYSSVVAYSSTSETTMSGIEHSGFGDNIVIEVSDSGNTPGRLKKTFASRSTVVLESVRKNLSRFSL